ncbi:MAG: hypothetical protein A2Y86_03930 [Candidatus Aminicenantes bacterium RBG_13_62_12]|nr:MAG: hypothetical protein A2Y86_03930 [Candidatus Aminicenantes bacterium RBG_13_62_12]
MTWTKEKASAPGAVPIAAEVYLLGLAKTQALMRFSCPFPKPVASLPNRAWRLTPPLDPGEFFYRRVALLAGRFLGRLFN